MTIFSKNCQIWIELLHIILFFLKKRWTCNDFIRSDDWRFWVWVRSECGARLFRFWSPDGDPPDLGKLNFGGRLMILGWIGSLSDRGVNFEFSWFFVNHSDFREMGVSFGIFRVRWECLRFGELISLQNWDAVGRVWGLFWRVTARPEGLVIMESLGFHRESSGLIGETITDGDEFWGFWSIYLYPQRPMAFFSSYFSIFWEKYEVYGAILCKIATRTTEKPPVSEGPRLSGVDFTRNHPIWRLAFFFYAGDLSIHHGGFRFAKRSYIGQNGQKTRKCQKTRFFEFWGGGFAMWTYRCGFFKNVVPKIPSFFLCFAEKKRGSKMAYFLTPGTPPKKRFQSLFRPVIPPFLSHLHL